MISPSEIIIVISKIQCLNAEDLIKGNKLRKVIKLN